MSDFRRLTLYVLRHGQTEDNLSGTITAQANSPLTALGRAQAADKGRVLLELTDNLESLAFVASPLHRACVTMELAREAAGLAPLPYTTDPRLMEMAFGDWTGRKLGNDRYAPDQPSAHQQWDIQPPHGESQKMLHERVGRYLETITRDSVIVCHARVVCMIRSHMLELSPAETMLYDPPNAGIVRLCAGSEATFGE